MQPIDAAERYRIIDVIRGVALFGVLMVNLLTGFRVSLFAHILQFHSHPGALNRAIDVLCADVLEFKAITLFSILFGVGVAIQAERAANRSLFLLRRFLVLLGIGLVHFLFIWNGDILALYAVCGLLMIPVLRLPTPAILAIGVGAILLPLFTSFGVQFPAGGLSLEAEAQLATRIYAHGTAAEIFRLRIDEGIHFIVPLLELTLARTFGLMLCGVALWRSSVLRNPAQHRRTLFAVFIAGGLIGSVSSFLQGTFALTSVLPLALAYGALLLLLFPHSQPTALAAIGQMALTNYLMQSIVLGFVFYSYGLGLFGSMSPTIAALIGIALYAVQLATSVWWLKRFRFGPVEWLWRSLTYGRRQPFRIGNNPAICDTLPAV